MQYIKNTYQKIEYREIFKFAAKKNIYGIFICISKSPFFFIFVPSIG